MYEKYKLVFVILMVFLLVGTVSASDYRKHKFNESLDIVITSNDAISCNITYVQVANNSANVFELAMSQSGRTFYQTLDGGNFTQLGDTCVGVVCYDGSNYEDGSVCREVTPNGEEVDGSKTTFNIVLLVILTVFFILALIGLFTINDYRGKFALYWVCHVLLIGISFVAWRYGQDFLFSDGGASGIFKVIFWVSTTAVLPMLLLSIAWIVYIHTVTDEINDLMERGLTPEEAFERRSSKKWH